MKKTTIALRLTAILLSMVMLMTFAPLTASAEPADVEDNETAVEAAADAQGGFWEKNSFLHYAFDPSQMLVYNRDNAFQHVFGFNKVYDIFTGVMNVYADTMRFTFTYEGKDWLIQLWKGAYAIVLAAGGEVGIYNKPTDRKIEHYDSANKAEDLMNVGMSMYNNEKFMFTRSVGKRWWTTGFQVNPVIGIRSRTKPRHNLTMDAKIQLKSAKMAQLFRASLLERGFREVGSINGIGTPEVFTVNGSTVHLVWKYLSEAHY